MGRVSEFIAFINEDKIPTEEDMKFLYSHISKTKKLKETRKKYKKNIKNDISGKE